MQLRVQTRGKALSLFVTVLSSLVGSKSLEGNSLAHAKLLTASHLPQPLTANTLPELDSRLSPHLTSLLNQTRTYIHRLLDPCPSFRHHLLVTKAPLVAEKPH
jgi:hypothetical protein